MMTDFGRRPKVLVFFADAVPTDDEREMVYDLPRSVDVATRNAAAVQPGDKPEQADYVIGAAPKAYDAYPRFDSAAERTLRADAKQARKDHEAAMKEAAGLAANSGVKAQYPQQTGDKPQILAAADPDLAAIHGADTRPLGERPPKLGGVNLETAPQGFPGSIKPDGEGGEGGGAPAGGEGTTAPATPAPGAPVPQPTPAWGKGSASKTK